MGIVVKGRENVLVFLMISYGFDRAQGTLVLDGVLAKGDGSGAGHPCTSSASERGCWD